MKKKTFDCVEIKRACQEKIRQQVKGMKPSEEVAFFRRAGEKLQQRIDSAKASSAHTTSR
ncbi:MAG: hypothetical protein SVV80_11305 [Planctomycetota bacterium]|nr:hypothetical protein [Planctomycetota bacterium]